MNKLLYLSGNVFSPQHLLGDTLQIELEFRNVGFLGEWKTGVPREKNREPTTNTLQLLFVF